jgi:protein tyrosine phosphatase (PTP) superfamily phosphohydrolase (DUF442 family)
MPLNPAYLLAPLVVLGALVGCATTPKIGAASPEQKPGTAEPATPDRPQGMIEGERLGNQPGVKRVSRLNNTLYSGGRPEGDEGLQTLRNLGIKTILTVDEDEFAADAAKALGMAYVQVAFDYDGVPDDTGRQLVEAIRTAQKPVYIHCHAGKHRSSTAVAYWRVLGLGWAPQDAKLDMRYMKCSPNYEGLYASIDRAAELRAK